MAQEDWTEERVAILKRHWKKDKSAREIAEVIGMPRNAVIGKAQRMGLGASRPPPTTRAERAKGSPRKQRQAKVEAARATLSGPGAGILAKSAGELFWPTPSPARAPAPSTKPPKLTVVKGGRLTMADLTAHSCRWPFGEVTRDLTFCGARTIEGSPYCAHHEVVAHQPTPPRRKAVRHRQQARRLDLTPRQPR